MTGFTQDQREKIITRDRERCRRCGGNRPTDIHHRQPRGMGGSREANKIGNGVLLCRLCHSWVESHREQAGTDGWLVPRALNPALTPITDIWGRKFQLDHEGQAVEL